MEKDSEYMKQLGAGTAWKPGETGNPNGRPKKLVTILQDKGFAKSEIADAFEQLAWFTEEELANLYKSPTTPVIVKVAAKAYRTAMSKGDLNFTKIMLEYVLGKPKQQIDATIEGTITWHEERTYEADDHEVTE